MAEFSAGLQTRLEERYVISLFLLLLGEVLQVFHDMYAGHSPSNHEKLASAIIRYVRLIGRIGYI